MTMPGSMGSEIQLLCTERTEHILDDHIFITVVKNINHVSTTFIKCFDDYMSSFGIKTVIPGGLLMILEEVRPYELGYTPEKTTGNALW